MNAQDAIDRKSFAIISKDGNERAYVIIGNASNSFKILVRTRPTWVSKNIVSRVEYR
jgi:hypothetical protein